MIRYYIGAINNQVGVKLFRETFKFKTDIDPVTFINRVVSRNWGEPDNYMPDNGETYTFGGGEVACWMHHWQRVSRPVYEALDEDLIAEFHNEFLPE